MAFNLTVSKWKWQSLRNRKSVLPSLLVLLKVSNNLVTLQTCLTSMMGRPISIDQLRQDVGQMIEKITHVTLMFRRIKLRMEEYVCLKVIAMLNQGMCYTLDLLSIFTENLNSLLQWAIVGDKIHEPGDLVTFSTLEYQGDITFQMSSHTSL